VTDAGSAATDATITDLPVERCIWTDPCAQSRRLRSSSGAVRHVRSAAAAGMSFAATNDNVGAEWQAPRRLEAWARIATRLTIADGEAHTLDLRIAK
jgi:hypothetical protein